MLPGEKLSRLIATAGRTELAGSLRITRALLNKFLRGSTRPSVKTATALARHFNVDPLWLMDDEQPWPPVQLSSALAVADREDADDTTRARHALHRCIDLLPGEALMRVVEFAQTAMADSVAKTLRLRNKDVAGAESGHALRHGPARLSHSRVLFVAPCRSSVGGEPSDDFSEASRGAAVGGDVRCNAASRLSGIPPTGGRG